MARPGVRTGLVAGALVAVLGAAGCGGEPVEPEPLETSEPTSASPTPTPTPTPSPEPSVRPGETEEMAFVRQYVDLLNDARRTGDVSKVAALSTKDCRSCNGFMKVTREIHQSGGRYIGDYRWRITEFAAKPTGENPVELAVYIETKDLQVVRKAGGKPEKWPGETEYNVFKLVPEGEGWKVSEFYST